MYDEAEQQNGRIARNYRESYGAISHGIEWEAIKRIERSISIYMFFLLVKVCRYFFYPGLSPGGANISFFLSVHLQFFSHAGLQFESENLHQIKKKKKNYSFSLNLKKYTL